MTAFPFQLVQRDEPAALMQACSQHLEQCLQQRLWLSFKNMDFCPERFELIIHRHQRLSDEMPMPTSIMRILQKIELDAIQQQHRTIERYCLCQWLMIREAEIALEPNNVHEACSTPERRGFAISTPRRPSKRETRPRKMAL